jgi:glycosyltransferase involved in cell wall biosynthesis
MIMAVCFTNFGPYHLARLRSLAQRLGREGGSLLAYEVASSERTYPWKPSRTIEPFEWITLFPDHVLETLQARDCARAFTAALDRDRPDVLAVAGYARPESVAGAVWARRNGRPAILMSESQRIDRNRSWWREMIKRRRIRLFDAALVGGPRHRDYLTDLGMPESLISFGYNAVDNSYYQHQAELWRKSTSRPRSIPDKPFFLSVCRFAPEKNLGRLVKAFISYRDRVSESESWDLVLCGDGPEFPGLCNFIGRTAYSKALHLPGFLQSHELTSWYAQASAFVLPSLSEPWGLVVNEAASAGLPVLVSNRAGCAETLVPAPEGTTGAQFDPFDVEELTSKLAWMSSLSDHERYEMGQRAIQIVNHWGPERFADGLLDAVSAAMSQSRHSIQQPLVQSETK